MKPLPDTSSRILNAGEVGLPAERAAAMLPVDLIRDDEVIILLLRPNLLFIPLSCLGSLMFILIICLLLALISHWAPWIGWSDEAALGLGVALCALRLGWQALEWYSRVFVLTDRRVIRRMGVLRIAVFETHLHNIQHTTVFARLRERLFGLGSIGFATAGSDVFEAYWVMISQPFAVQKIIVETIQRYGKHGRV